MPQHAISPEPTSLSASLTARPAQAGPLASPLLTTEEVARLLRVDPSSVRRWRAEQPPQGPPFIRLSERVVLYAAQDLQHWLDTRRTTPHPRQKAA
ncbi:helix-turn-helix domain-containing protein [Actinacidiphila sp. DG2A-62]|uniref:helix-turn-helix transcriptional regulator n=1 Tax=Actinacidiphila sp. DG2A-62 TaxID=3108821 RepID=UPI002DB64501|nr:helix-turn-helix domain-containing protein [Actinacidiphila sp. DG2A-62]MEC3998019.1 helix-turn-helix domain-containing protein [Actinacidiphila sp. DG2A-62]